MGLDAYVRCRCWQDGLTTPPPVAAELIRADDEGLELDLPFDGNEEVFRAYWAWEQDDACPHPEMEACSERLSNWSGYRQFQQALADAGWDHFPTLRRYLPEVNGGQLPSDAAPAVLDELACFRTQAVLGPVTELLDKETDEVVFTHIRSYGGEFGLGTMYTMGIDADEFFLRDRDPDGLESEVFRSTGFSQEVLDEPDQAGSSLVRFTALADGVAVERRVSPAALYSFPGPVGTYEIRFPAMLGVRTRLETADEYDYIVQPLIRLCQAAAGTGNPINWC